MPASVGDRLSLPVLVRALGVVAFFAYLATVMGHRFGGLFHPWSVDGDQFQAVFHYFRYREDGLFPPGELFTDFAFVMHAPPIWWLMMATLSTFIEPLSAAKFLHVVSYFAAIAGMYFVVRSRTNHWIGLLGAALLVRSVNFHGIIAGGYARSFGPALIIWFLYFFLKGRHRACLAMLVLQAALYPSVVIPCGITYGVYVLVKGPTWKERRRRVIGMFVTGLLVLSFGLYQDITRPKWWGGVVTLEEAMEMPAWRRGGGRFNDAPLNPAPAEIRGNATRPLARSGNIWGPDFLARWSRANYNAYPLIPTAVAIGVLLVLLLLGRARGSRAGPRAIFSERESDDDTRFPWQLLAMFGGALVGYFLARALAFRLYMPYRVISHGLPYVVIASMAIFPYVAARALGARQRLATGLTAALGVAPVFLIAGDGLGNERPTYGNFERDKATWEAVEALPRDAIVAAPVWLADKIPLLSKHRVYSNRNLCQPFRKGIYAECERRLILTYEALYATDLRSIARFAEEEKVDYFVVDRGRFGAKVDGRLFNPVKRKLRGAHQRGRKRGFAFEKVPEQTVVWRGPRHFIVDLGKLRASLASVEEAEEP
jgi:hypothetical protein